MPLVQRSAGEGACLPPVRMTQAVKLPFRVAIVFFIVAVVEEERPVIMEPAGDAVVNAGEPAAATTIKPATTVKPATATAESAAIMTATAAIMTATAAAMTTTAAAMGEGWRSESD